MVFIATFNNISVISWRSVLLVEETRVPGGNHRPVAVCNVLSQSKIYGQQLYFLLILFFLSFCVFFLYMLLLLFITKIICKNEYFIIEQPKYHFLLARALFIVVLIIKP